MMCLVWCGCLGGTSTDFQLTMTHLIRSDMIHQFTSLVRIPHVFGVGQTMKIEAFTFDLSDDTGKKTSTKLCDPHYTSVQRHLPPDHAFL